MIRSCAVLVALLALAPPLLAQDGLEPPPARKERGLVFVAPEAWRATEPVEPERGAWLVRPTEEAPRVRVSLRRQRRGRPLAERVTTWTRAFVGPGGEAVAARTEPVALEDAAGVTATLVALRGTHVAALEPGEEDPRPREGWAALHAVIEGPDGTWIASVVGPAASVDAAKAGLVALVKSARVGLVDAEPPGEELPDVPEPDREEDGD